MYPQQTEEQLAQDSRYAAAKGRLDYEQARVAKLAARHETASAKSSTLRRLVGACEDFLKSLPAGVEIDEAVVTPKKADSVESVRAKVAEAKAAIDGIQHQPYTAAEAKQIISAQVEALRKRGQPNLLGVLHHREDMRLQRLKAERADGAPNHEAFVPDVLGLMAWLLGDKLEAALHDEIDLRADHEHAISATDRAAAVEKANADLLALERFEAALVETTGAQYRPETDPRAVLAIEVSHD